ncbi:transmembrane protein, putative (macronuclear) [Tetrahymena thermophila SB210]|uniref:Transmembrane protein, putative n=1 Tax=Tetrahymena thermophila (strain SB210) TaxID=312017 RepID=I7M622_TETTS|nr:transmembrane protein, putative [Tetrahymena thermophila SB210]EAR84059.1 transmembrane protein, putative [Tetrahymena thermophila SB210]|eukprot:XP_001031722.1 transmembrane protein, putative [Tetrahymena thermophila SB210]
MKKQIILVLVIALILSSCSALRYKKRHNHRLFAQVKQDGDPQNATLQELLKLDVSNFSCDNLAEYKQYQGRMEDFVSFLNNNPEEELLQSINELGQASLLLKKAKQLFDHPSEVGSLSQTSKNKSKKAKHVHYGKLSKHLNNISEIVDPQLVQEIQSAIVLISTSDDNEQIKQKIDEVIKIIQVLKEQCSNLLGEKDSFEAYSEELTQQINDIKAQSSNCQ